MAKFAVRDREAGNIIEYVNSIQEGRELIKQFEESDKKEGIYTKDFYEVATIEDGK